MRASKIATKRQGGFTLIELMIVVAIIGILASIALPFYKRYTLHVKASEAAALIGGVKHALAEAASKGALSTSVTHASLGLAEAGDIKGNYVKSVTATAEDSDTATITVAFFTKTERPNVPTELSGNTIIWTGEAHGGSMSWTVSGGTVAEIYRPKQ